MSSDRFFTAPDAVKFRILGTYIAASLAAAILFAVATAFLAPTMGTPHLVIGIAVKLLGTLTAYTYQRREGTLPIDPSSARRTAVVTAIMTEIAVLAALFYLARDALATDGAAD